MLSINEPCTTFASNQIAFVVFPIFSVNFVYLGTVIIKKLKNFHILKNLVDHVIY